VISVMCNPGLRPRHWSHMSEVAKFDLTPDSSTTLRKMLRLNIMPYMDQFEVISAGATKVTSDCVGLFHFFKLQILTNVTVLTEIIASSWGLIIWLMVKG